MVEIGETIRVMDHDVEGLRWTVGQVGYVKAPAHIEDFDANYPGGTVSIPPVFPGDWIVSLDHNRAKGGYAYASLSEDCLAPHACTSRCGAHKGLLG